MFRTKLSVSKGCLCFVGISAHEFSQRTEKQKLCAPVCFSLSFAVWALVQLPSVANCVSLVNIRNGCLRLSADRSPCKPRFPLTSFCLCLFLVSSVSFFCLISLRIFLLLLARVGALCIAARWLVSNPFFLHCICLTLLTLCFSTA